MTLFVRPTSIGCPAPLGTLQDVCGLKPLDVVADISATNHVSQAITRGMRDTKTGAQRPSASGKSAKHLPAHLPTPGSSPVDSGLTDLGKYTLKLDTGKLNTGGPVHGPLDLVRNSSPDASFEREGSRQSLGGGSTDSPLDGTNSEAARVPTVDQGGGGGGGGGQRRATAARRGSWTRPADPRAGPKGGLDGVDVDCPFSPPSEASSRAPRRRRRSKKVAVVESSGIESGAQAHDRSDREDGRDNAVTHDRRDREVVGDVALDAVGRNATRDNHAGLDAKGGQLDPLCVEDRGYSSVQMPIAHRLQDVVNGRDQPAGAANLAPSVDDG